MKRPRVIYIMGCGRSGTTILNILLGNNSGLLAVGELNRFSLSWAKNNMCSCGTPVKSCEIWRNIGKLYFTDTSKNDCSEMLHYQMAVERQRAIWKMAFGLYERDKFQLYETFMHNIYKSLQDVSSCKAIVDSSKSVGRAYSLLRNKKIDVQLIHLVRDPRGMYYSFQKKDVVTPVKGLWSTALYWNITNFLASIIKLRFGDKKVLQIRYEDLVYCPGETIDKISFFLYVNLSQVKEKLKNEVKLDRGHIASGNRLRSQKSALKLTPDFEWKRKLSFSQRLILNIICSPMMVKHKYFSNNLH